MAVDINNLLKLSSSERKKIAKKIWNSLDPSNSISKEDQKTIKLLEKRWNDFEAGRSKTYNAKEFKKKMESER